VTDQCPIQVTVHQSMLWIQSAKHTKTVSNVPVWNMVTHALVNLPDTDMASPMVKQSAKIDQTHVNVHSVNAMPNSLASTLVKPEFLMRNIICSGVQTMVVPCGIQPMTMLPVHVVAVESMIHNAVPQKTELVPPFSIMPLQRPAALMAVSSLTQANVKFTNGTSVGNLPKNPRVALDIKTRNPKYEATYKDNM
jgi:hypothetical protein